MKTQLTLLALLAILLFSCDKEKDKPTPAQKFKGTYTIHYTGSIMPEQFIVREKDGIFEIEAKGKVYAAQLVLAGQRLQTTGTYPCPAFDLEMIQIDPLESGRYLITVRMYAPQCSRMLDDNNEYNKK